MEQPHNPVYGEASPIFDTPSLFVDPFVGFAT